VQEVLDTVDFGERVVVVRVNALSTPWGRKDVAAVLDMPQVQAVALPKVEGPNDVAEMQRVMRQAGRSSQALPVWAFIESANGVLAAASTASDSDAVQVLVAGCNDLTKDLRARFTASRAPLQHSLASIVLAARAAGIACLDGVPAAVK
jgi:citrate lyase beta subunit